MEGSSLCPRRQTQGQKLGDLLQFMYSLSYASCSIFPSFKSDDLISPCHTSHGFNPILAAAVQRCSSLSLFIQNDVSIGILEFQQAVSPVGGPSPVVHPLFTQFNTGVRKWGEILAQTQSSLQEKAACS